MVEKRHWFFDTLPHVILCLGVFIVAFPVWLAFVASTHDAATVVGGNMPATPGSQALENYYRAIFVGGSAAQSVVLMVIVIALTAVQFRYVERKVQY